MTERDIIKQFLTSIGASTSGENVEKVTTLIDRLESYKRLKRSMALSGVVKPASGSLRKAVAIYNLPERVEWIKQREGTYEWNQAMLADAISEWYSQIMQMLPHQKRAIMAVVLRGYREGVTSVEIANTLFASVDSVLSQLSSLRKVGFVATSDEGKVTYRYDLKTGVTTRTRKVAHYYVPDKWWHLAFAVKSDGRFLKWWEEHRSDKDLHDVVDRFISSIQT